jgi:hypothetical protein
MKVLFERSSFIYIKYKTLASQNLSDLAALLTVLATDWYDYTDFEACQIKEYMKVVFLTYSFIYTWRTTLASQNLSNLATFLIIFLGLNHSFQHVPHFFRNGFQKIELSGTFKPFATIDGNDFTVDIG